MATITNGFDPTVKGQRLFMTETPKSLSSDEEKMEAIKEGIDTANADNLAWAAEATSEETSQPNAETTEETATTPEEPTDEATKESSDDEKNMMDFAGLRNLPFIELYNRWCSAKSNIEELESCMSMLESIGGADSDVYDAGAKAIAQSNVLNEKNYRMSVKRFYKEYPNAIHEANRIADLLHRMTLEYTPDLQRSTSFISRSMIESARLREATMGNKETLGDNKDYILKRLNAVIKAYENRTDFSFLLNKLRYPANVLKIYKNFCKIGVDKVLAYINQIFMPVFHDEHMLKFRKAFKKFSLPEEDNNVLIAFNLFFTYWLANIYEKEHKSGKSSHVKVFVMNYYDMESGIYDLPGGIEHCAAVGGMFATLLIMTCYGNHSMKQLNAEIPKVVDNMLENVQSQYVKLCEEYPGKKIPESTAFSSICPELTYDGLMSPDDDESADVPADIGDPNNDGNDNSTADEAPKPTVSHSGTVN